MLVLQQEVFNVLQIDLRHITKLNVQMLQMPRQILAISASIFNRSSHEVDQLRLESETQLIVHSHTQILELQRLISFIWTTQNDMLHQFEGGSISELTVPYVQYSQQHLRPLL